jgi:hypothetical protein
MTEMKVYNLYAHSYEEVVTLLGASGADRVNLPVSVDFTMYLTLIRPLLHITPDISLGANCHLIILSSLGRRYGAEISSRLRLFVAKSTTSSIYSPNSPWQCKSSPYLTTLNNLIYLVHHGCMFQGRIFSPEQGDSVSDNENKNA